VQSVHRCCKANILFVVVATNWLLQTVVVFAASVHHDCDLATRENENTDRWTNENCCEDVVNHLFFLCPDEP